ATEFAKAVEVYGKSVDDASLERLKVLRSQIIECLLAAKQIDRDDALSASTIVAACLNSGLRGHPRTGHEEALVLRCLAALDGAAPGEAFALWFAAMLMVWHACELPRLPQLSDVPQEMRPSWLSLLLESPQAFSRRGDGEQFAHYLEGVCDQILQHLRS